MKIFNMFKKNQKIAFLPEDFVDIHSHILPGMDDGSPSFEYSVALLREMKRLGVKSFVLTPHVMDGYWENTTASILERFEELKNYLSSYQEFDNLEIKVAAEYMIDNNFKENLIPNKDLLPIHDNIVLVEMSYLAPPIHLLETISELQVAGFRPLLAHPERYKSFHADLTFYDTLKEVGCTFQLNMMSLTNYYGKDVHQVAVYLLKNKLIDYLGSDVHRQKHIEVIKTIEERPKMLELVASVFEKEALSLSNKTTYPFRSSKSFNFVV